MSPFIKTVGVSDDKKLFQVIKLRRKFVSSQVDDLKFLDSSK